jgi:hypothetical protein
MAVLALAEPLTKAGRYPQELTLAIIKDLLKAGGNASHEGYTLFQAYVAVPPGIPQEVGVTWP